MLHLIKCYLINLIICFLHQDYSMLTMLISLLSVEQSKDLFYSKTYPSHLLRPPSITSIMYQVDYHTLMDAFQGTKYYHYYMALTGH